MILRLRAIPATVLFLVVSIIFLTHFNSHAAPAAAPPAPGAGAPAGVNVGGSNCSSRPDFGDAVSKTSGVVNGKTCSQQVQLVDACCTQGSHNADACKRVLVGIAGTTPAGGIGPVMSPIDGVVQFLWGVNPTTGGAGASGATVDAKIVAGNAAMRSAKMSGMCQAISQSCAASCGADPRKPKCDTAAKSSTTFCTHAVESQKQAEGVDPSKVGSDPSGGGGGGGGSNPSGGSGSGAPTQQPGGAGSGMNPSMLGELAKALMQQDQNKNQDQQQQQDDKAMEPASCETNSNLAGCPLKKPDDVSWNKKQGDSEFKEASASENGGGNFDVGRNNATNPTYNGNGGEAKPSAPPTNAAIPNGGGQIPGQGGGGAPAAAGGGGGGGYGGANRAATEIMHGLMSGGGYSAMNASMQLQNGGGGGYSYNQPHGPGEAKPNMDLRNFLPKGKEDPRRKLAGGASNFQVQPQTVDIWARITERFRARCIAGLLRDCK